MKMENFGIISVNNNVNVSYNSYTGNKLQLDYIYKCRQSLNWNYLKQILLHIKLFIRKWKHSS